MSKPFKDTLWIDCLFEMIEKTKEEGLTLVDLQEVDKLVIEKSKSIGLSEYENAVKKFFSGDYDHMTIKEFREKVLNK